MRRHVLVLDSATEGRKRLKVTIEETELGLLVRPAGHGDKVSANGNGWPILLENRNGTPYLVVWADISQEDPTHVIDLSQASEKRRRG